MPYKMFPASVPQSNHCMWSMIGTKKEEPLMNIITQEAKKRQAIVICATKKLFAYNRI